MANTKEGREPLKKGTPTFDRVVKYLNDKLTAEIPWLFWCEMNPRANVRIEQTYRVYATPIDEILLFAEEFEEFPSWIDKEGKITRQGRNLNRRAAAWEKSFSIPLCDIAESDIVKYKRPTDVDCGHAFEEALDEYFNSGANELFGSCINKGRENLKWDIKVMTYDGEVIKVEVKFYHGALGTR